MESERSSKRRGFAKSKLLASFYRAAKPKTKPKLSPPEPLPLGLGFIIVNQDQVFQTHNPKVAFVMPPNSATLDSFYDDEAVDTKAATYISAVRERFRLERNNGQDM